MPRVSPRAIVAMNGWPGGLVKDRVETLFQPDELSEAMNVVLGLRGEIQKRRGYSLWSATPAEKVCKLSSVRTQDTVDNLLGFTADGDSWVWENLSPTPTAGPNFGSFSNAQRWPVGIAVANGIVYVTRRTGVDAQKYDGTTWTAMPTFPQAQFLSYRYNQMHAANVTETGPNTMWISTETDVEDWTTEAVRLRFSPFDGYQIHGIHPAGDQLMVFKDHSIFMLAGKVRSEFSIYQLDDLRGTVSPETIRQVRGLICFYDRDTGVWAWDGSAFHQISQKINRYILENADYANAFKATALVFEDKYILSLPWGQNTNNHAFCYSTLTKAWTEWDVGFNAAIQQDRELFFGTPSNPVQLDGVWRAEGYTDDQTPIQVVVETPWIFPGETGARSRMRRVEINVNETDALMNLTLYQDYVNIPMVTRSIEADNEAVDKPEPIEGLIVHTVSGRFDWEAAGSPDTLADVWIIAGGGSGGGRYAAQTWFSGGGGAGGLLHLSDVPVSGDVDIIIGVGGVGSTASGQKGGNSSFGANVALGGGRGAIGPNQTGGLQAAGGCGGGATTSHVAGPNGVAGLGSQGGNGGGAPNAGGGGGGGGGATQNGFPGAGEIGGAGGEGIDLSAIVGTDIGDEGWFCGGGGARGADGSGLGGKGGGGRAQYGAAGGPGVSGMPNTGGGGGAGGFGFVAGSGGSGIVIIRVDEPVI